MLKAVLLYIISYQYIVLMNHQLYCSFHSQMTIATVAVNLPPNYFDKLATKICNYRWWRC